MKTKVIALTILLIIILLLSGCNKQIVDTVYQFNYAIIELPDGQIIEGRVQSWKDYDESDQLQIKINDIYYLVHSSDVVLMSKPMSDIQKSLEEK